MKRLKCLVADDEQMAVDAMKDLINRRHDLICTDITTDARQVVDLVEKHRIELVFLDLHMPHVHGISLIEQLRGRAEIICCSADQLYGEKLFMLGVAFYLFKPIQEEKFATAIERVWEIRATKAKADYANGVVPLDLHQNIMLKKLDGKHISIELIDMECIESSGDNCIVTHTDGTDEVCYGLGLFEKLLPAKNFIRVHKGFMVAFKNIRDIDYTNGIIKLRNSSGTTIPIGPTYRKKVREVFVGKELKNI